MLETIKSLLDAGGWVMYILLVLSLLSVTMSFERAVYWWRTHSRHTRTLVLGVIEKIRRGDLRSAHAAASADNSVYGRFVAGMLEQSSALSKRRASEAAAQEQIELIRTEIERFGTMLSTIITAAPMIGILGTVIGIIASFSLFGQADEINDPTAIAGGIATALYTTAFGLVVALITLFPFSVTLKHVDRCFNILEILAAAIVEAEQSGETLADSAAKDEPATPAPLAP